MYLHPFWPNDPEAPRKIVIEADWYEQVGTNQTNGLPQIKFQANFSSCSLAFLDDCIPENCTFFPSNPWDDNCDLFDVLLHHNCCWYILHCFRLTFCMILRTFCPVFVALRFVEYSVRFVIPLVCFALLKG